MSPGQQWDRLALRVRCGYEPRCRCALQRYLGMSWHLAAGGVQPPLQVWRRVLTVLLQTAQDEGLPLQWRARCLDHVGVPLQRLESMLALHDPIAWRALNCAVQAAQDQLLNAAQTWTPPDLGG